MPEANRNLTATLHFRHKEPQMIGGAKKVEHYEIDSYGTLCALAKHLKMNAALTLLKATLAEEKATDEKLTRIAEGGGNQKAAAQ